MKRSMVLCAILAVACGMGVLMISCGGGGSGGGEDNGDSAGSSVYMYVVNGLSENVFAYAISPSTGIPVEISGSPYSVGAYPQDITVDPSGTTLYVANTYDDNISAFAISPSTGALTEFDNSPYSSGSAPFNIAIDPTGRYAYAANYDSQISPFPSSITGFVIWPWSGDLLEMNESPFAETVHPNGTQDLAVSPDGQSLYGIHYGNGTVSAYAINPSTGNISTVGSPLATGDNPEDVVVHPSGNYVYVASYPYMSGNIQAYSVSPSTGALTYVESYSNSAVTELAVSPDGFYVYSRMYGDYLAAWACSPTTGALSAVTGSPVQTNAQDSVTGIAVHPSGRYVYAIGDNNPGTISVFTVDVATGAITEVAGSPVNAGNRPSGVAIVER